MGRSMGTNMKWNKGRLTLIKLFAVDVFGLVPH